MVFPKVLWILFNLFLIVVIAYIVINTYKTYIKIKSNIMCKIPLVMAVTL